MSQELDYSALKERMEKIAAVKPRIPGMKQAILDELGPRMLSEVRSHTDSSGKVASWQNNYQGSRHGYSAVRAAVANTWSPKGKSYAVGYVTNAIENGHRVRGPSGQDKRYRYRGRGLSRVPGKGFYKASRAAVDAMQSAAVAQLAEELAKALEE